VGATVVDVLNHPIHWVAALVLCLGAGCYDKQQDARALYLYVERVCWDRCTEQGGTSLTYLESNGALVCDCSLVIEQWEIPYPPGISPATTRRLRD